MDSDKRRRKTERDESQTLSVAGGQTHAESHRAHSPLSPREERVGREPERGVAHWFFEQGASSPFPSPPLCGREGIHVNRKFLGVFTDILLLLVLIVSLGLSTSALAAEKPNIIFLLTDDMGYGDCGCYGGKFVPTPNIDRLAKEGTKFTQFYAMAPVCSPSRTGFLTGTFPARWRITTFLQTRAGNRASEQVDFLDPKAPSIARTLKANGYATGHFGKWHMGGGRDVTNEPLFAAYGFDEHAGTYESPEPDRTITATNWIFSQYDKVKRWDRSAYFVDKTLDFLRRHKGKPCYVNLWPDDVHTPWIPEGTDIANRRRENDESEPNFKAVLAEYDKQVGRLVAGLKELGIEDNTILIFSSDNGPMPSFR